MRLLAPFPFGAPSSGRQLAIPLRCTALILLPLSFGAAMVR